MVLYAVEKRNNRKILDKEIYDGSYTKLITAEDFNFTGKVIISIYFSTSIPTLVQLPTSRFNKFLQNQLNFKNTALQTKILFFLPQIVHRFSK